MSDPWSGGFFVADLSFRVADLGEFFFFFRLLEVDMAGHLTEALIEDQ